MNNQDENQPASDFISTPGCQQVATREEQDAKLADLVKKGRGKGDLECVYILFKTHSGHLVFNVRAGILRKNEYNVALTKLACIFKDDYGKECGKVIGCFSGGGQSNSSLRNHAKAHGLDPDNGWVKVARKSNQSIIKQSNSGQLFASVRF
jgi:hypothetical protein